MDPLTADTLEVPGAHLAYEVHGSGPVLLLIPGGWGDSGMFAAMVPLLADEYTVVTYDPRGLSHSTLQDPAQDVPVAVQADDAHRLLAAVTHTPASVLGISGGAVTGLALISHHPDQVRTLVAHEPPLLELLPARVQLRDWADEVSGIYDRAGPGPAMQAFLTGLGLADSPGAAETESPDPELLAAFAQTPEQMRGNLELFFAHLFRPLVGYLPDAAALRAAAARIVVAAGTESTGQVSHRGAVALADLLGTTTVAFPGDHGGFMSQPEAFARTLHQLLTETT